MAPLSGIVGHETPKRFFANFLADRDRMPHAILLSGPPGVGKFAAALSFARAFNCTMGSKPDCECLHCRQIAMGTFSDVLINSSLSEIKAEQMRQLISEVVITPRASTHRLVILDDFERVNETSANIFLKTLEEPPRRLRFMLITSRVERLLPTIRSRCIPIEFHPSGTEETAKALGSVFGDADGAAIAHAAATGRFGKAARELYADAVFAPKAGGKRTTEPYAKLLEAFTDGLLSIRADEFAHYLRGPYQTLLESVEARWQLKQLLPKGLDIPGLRRFIADKLKDFEPINYLMEERAGPAGLREYDKAKILLDDLTQELYSRLAIAHSDKPALVPKLLHFLSTARGIRRNLDGYRNIELSFEKLLIAPNISSRP